MTIQVHPLISRPMEPPAGCSKRSFHRAVSAPDTGSVRGCGSPQMPQSVHFKPADPHPPLWKTDRAGSIPKAVVQEKRTPRLNP